MNNKTKQRAVIEFLTKENCTPVEIHRRLKNVYGGSVLDLSNVRRWVTRFKEGDSDIADKKRSGRPSTSLTANNKRLADEMIQKDRRIKVQELAEALNLSYGSAQMCICELGYHKVCAKWAPKELTADLRARRREVAHELLSSFEEHQNDFFKDWVTGDETWAYLYEPESKVQSKQWRRSGSPRPIKFKATKSTQKVMTTIFWDTQGIVLIDFLEMRTTVNSDSYIETLKKLKRAISKKRPHKDIHSIQLHHDNARPHMSFATKQHIEKMGWSVVPHPPYSPDLAPCDFYLFGPLKNHIRGTRFDNVNEVKLAVKAWCKKQSSEFYQNGFDAWVKRWRKCIELNGDYVEN